MPCEPFDKGQGQKDESRRERERGRGRGRETVKCDGNRASCKTSEKDAPKENLLVQTKTRSKPPTQSVRMRRES